MESVDAPGTAAPLVCRGCAKAIEPDSKFCPYCRASTDGATPPVTPPPPPVTPPPSTLWDMQPSTARADLVLRASDSIWYSTEREVDPKPGQLRPLLVLDEQTVHLSHTDKCIEPEQILERVEKLIEVCDVPVQAKLLSTRWQSDATEVRPRIVASLKNHLYSDVKMIYGVDYMGKWASIKMYLAMEPPPYPLGSPPPPPPTRKPVEKVSTPMISLVFYAIGGLLLLSCFVTLNFVPLIGTAICGVIGYVNCEAAKSQAEEVSKSDFARNMANYERQKQENEQKIIADIIKQEEEHAKKSLLRTYKIDDMRLFSAAMKVVFEAVVDDIVSTGGGKVERIEGGKGGYLNEDGVTQLAPAPRQTDVAQDFDL